MSSIREETVKGIWWRQEAPERQLQGEITYGPASGATVNLFGHIHADLNQRSLSQRFTLQGITFQGKKVTLFDALITSSQFNMPGSTWCTVASSSGIVGGHYAQPADVRFRNVRVWLDGLRDWTWTSGIDFRHETEPTRALITYKVPDTVHLGKISDLVTTLEFSGSTSPGAGKLSIQEDCALVLEANTLTPYEKFADVFHPFQHFLSFALQCPALALHVIGHIDQPREVIQGQQIFEDFLVIRQLSRTDFSSKTLLPHDMLFTLKESGETAENSIGKFFSNYDRLKPALDLYMSTLYHPDQLLRLRFLTLAQCLEAYHRVSTHGKYMGDEQYSKGLKQLLWDSIPSEIDAPFRAALKNKLKYLNEYSLRKRIEILASKHTEIIGKLLGSADEFAESVSELRNKLTHPEPSSDALGKTEWKELWRLSEKLALLMETCFLDEFGFRRDRIRDIARTRSERARRVHFGVL
ncbi:MAG: hypothetical protein DME74_08860 [Verrucomicrobia bacterium]|nr:MAG: hypothetical protein DME74_08860 [Verrucomicrobiota bacterium]